MKPIEQLQEILCTVESVRDNIMEWKEWYKLEMTYTKWALMEYWYDENAWWEESITLKVWEDLHTLWDYEFTKEENIQDGWNEEYECTFKKLWNPLSLKHLFMFANEEAIFLSIKCDWDIIIHSYKYMWLWQVDEKKVRITTLDITKELHEQEDKVLLDIFNFLIKYQLNNTNRETLYN